MDAKTSSGQSQSSTPASRGADDSLFPEKTSESAALLHYVFGQDRRTLDVDDLCVPMQASEGNRKQIMGLILDILGVC